MDVSKNGGTPKSSILIGFSIINHQFWGTTFFGNTHMVIPPPVCFVNHGVFSGKSSNQDGVSIQRNVGGVKILGYDMYIYKIQI